MPKTNYKYTDLNFDFTQHPVKGDIVLSKDELAVRRALKYLLFTSYYERPFHPEIGGNINKILFEPITPISQNYIRKEILNVIQNFEPRVSVIDVIVDVSTIDQNALTITIKYYLINDTKQYEVSYVLERTR